MCFAFAMSALVGIVRAMGFLNIFTSFSLNALDLYAYS